MLLDCQQDLPEKEVLKELKAGPPRKERVPPVHSIAALCNAEDAEAFWEAPFARLPVMLKLQVSLSNQASFTSCKKPQNVGSQISSSSFLWSADTLRLLSFHFDSSAKARSFPTHKGTRSSLRVSVPEICFKKFARLQAAIATKFALDSNQGKPERASYVSAASA